MLRSMSTNLPPTLLKSIRLQCTICIIGLTVLLTLLFRMYNSTSNEFSIFFLLFCTYEGPVLLSIPALTWLAYRLSKYQIFDIISEQIERKHGRYNPVFLSAFISFLVSIAGTFLIHHNYPFSADEYAADFQAQIFASGRIFAIIPDHWEPFIDGMTPVFIRYHPIENAWFSDYLPVYAIIRSPFVYFQIGWFLNPLLNGISVLLVGATCVKIWPDDNSIPALACLFLASSTQFVAMSLSAYAFPAHLCLNLLWLFLYVDNRNWTIMLLPVVGVLSIGLHQPVMHCLFAAPFLFRFFLTRRWYLTGYLILVYALGILFWMFYLKTIRPEINEVVSSIFAFPQFKNLLIQFMNFLLLITWQPLLMLFVFSCFFSQHIKKVIVLDMAISFLVTFTFYFAVDFDQGHGWGYRYCHPILGILAILAAVGLRSSTCPDSIVSVRRFFNAYLLLSILLLFPFRSYEVEQEVRPFYLTSNLLDESHEPVLLLDLDNVWYGQDLIRNSHRFNSSNIRVDIRRLSNEQINELQNKYSAPIISSDKLRSRGIRSFARSEENIPKYGR